MEENADLVKYVIAVLFNDIAISHPLYCPDVKTEEDGERLSRKLPLVYIWNEDPTVGTFSVSINSPIVGETLEHFMPRSNSEFSMVRDQIIETVRDVSIKSIMSTCEKMGVLPSIVFSREQYLEMCKSAEPK